MHDSAHNKLTVIPFGAGFSALLVYALTSELFSRDSPTVLHEACEKNQNILGQVRGTHLEVRLSMFAKLHEPRRCRQG